MTLVGGTKTQASGKTLTSAQIVGQPYLVSTNGSLALGAQLQCSISGNNVVVTSYTALGIALGTDVGTYLVSIVGAV